MIHRYLCLIEPEDDEVQSMHACSRQAPSHNSGLVLSNPPDDVNDVSGFKQ